MKTVLTKLIKLYQIAISPLLPNCCRYQPTCSEYGILAINKHGVFYGLYLLIRRLLRCQPLGRSGYDPVP